jgi:hypothetical protein
LAKWEAENFARTLATAAGHFISGTLSTGQPGDAVTRIDRSQHIENPRCGHP